MMMRKNEKDKARKRKGEGEGGNKGKRKGGRLALTQPEREKQCPYGPRNGWRQVHHGGQGVIG